MTRALVMGEVCIDVIQFDPGSVPVLDYPVWARDTLIRLGGSACYVSQGLQALEVDVTLNSVVGDDWMAQTLLHELEQAGIHLDQVLFKEEVSTPICLGESSPGKKQFFGCSPFPPYPAELIDLPAIHPDLIYFGGYLLFPELWQGDLARMFAREKGQALIALDTQFLPIPVDLYREKALTRENLSDVDILLVNQGESLALTGNKSARQAARQLAELGPGTVVIKRGEQGGLVWSGGEFFESEPFPSSAHDLVGAGDFFGAAFSYGYLQGWDLQVVSDFANAYASLCISRTRKELPDAETTLAFMQTRRQTHHEHTPTTRTIP